MEVLHGWTVVSPLSWGCGDPVLRLRFGTAQGFILLDSPCMSAWGWLCRCHRAACMEFAVSGLEFIEGNALRNSCRDKRFFFSSNHELMKAIVKVILQRCYCEKKSLVPLL